MNLHKTIIGRIEKIELPELGLHNIPARIDTGAKTSSIWASNIDEENGVLSYQLFGENSKFYTGETISQSHYKMKKIFNSSGQKERRYAVVHKASIKGRKVKVTFTLANRSKQMYPILLGRNTLRGKFLVDVNISTPHIRDKHSRFAYLKEDKQNRKEES